jgi:hypothetical protein
MATFTIDESIDAISDPKPIETVTSHLLGTLGADVTASGRTAAAAVIAETL